MDHRELIEILKQLAFSTSDDPEYYRAELQKLLTWKPSHIEDYKGDFYIIESSLESSMNTYKTWKQAKDAADKENAELGLNHPDRRR